MLAIGQDRPVDVIISPLAIPVLVGCCNCQDILWKRKEVIGCCRCSRILTIGDEVIGLRLFGPMFDSDEVL